MKSLPYFLALLMAGTFFLSGCSTAQQWFAGEECECPPVEPCDYSEEAIAHAVVLSHVDYAKQRADEAQAVSVPDEEELDESPRSAEDLAYEVIDPTVPDATLEFDDDDERESLQERFGIDIPDDAQVFRHRFHPDNRSAVAVHKPGHYLHVYDDDDIVASIEFDEFEDVIPDDEALPVSSKAIDLVRERPTQLKLVHARSDDDGKTTYYVTIHKLIGPKIGTIFHKPVAQSDAEGTVSPLAKVRYLYGLDSRIIEWKPLGDDDEDEGEKEPTHYEWNPWEGVYRIPEPPPTAPDAADS